MSMLVKKTDVLVIGGGPAGSTVATHLRRKGWQVTLLEKDHHPRFHIGESLLPRNLELFEQLGVLDQVKKIGVVKNGADFTLPDSDRYVTYDFSDALEPSIPYAFQVRRSELDHILLNNSKSNGVEVLEGLKATHLNLDHSDKVIVTAIDSEKKECQYEAKFLIDASGRDTYLASKLSLKSKNPVHNSAAVFGHFRDVVRRDGAEKGNISIYWFEHGWFWLIPLRDGITSVGAVCWPEYLKTRQGALDNFLMDTIKSCEPLAQRMDNAKLESAVTATGNFSYQSKNSFGKRYLMVGDAFTFIDPVFSSGVFLAMYSAVNAANVVSECLNNPKRTDSLLKQHQRQIQRGISIFSWLIYRFTSPAMKKLFMQPSSIFQIQQAVTSLLTGDIFRDTPFKRRMLVFKIVYYLKSIALYKESIAAYRKRRAQIKKELGAEF